MSARDPRAERGFTLIEMLAAIFLTSVVISVAVAFYISLSRATEAATLKLRDSRHAATIMDRVARDLQSALLLVKPAEMDPLEHPWLFLAEASLEGEGADRVKFVLRRAEPAQATSQGASDLSTVSYMVFPSEEDEGFELYRFGTPGLPPGLDRDFPERDDPGARLVAADLESFSLHFRRGGGDDEEWQDSWDSSTIVGSSELPDEVEIRIAMHSAFDANANLDEFGGEATPTRIYKRRVSLLLRPIDLDAEIEAAIAASTEGSGENGCLTVSECLAKPQNQGLWQEYFDRCAADPVACSQIDSSKDECYSPELLPGAVACGS